MNHQFYRLVCGLSALVIAVAALWQNETVAAFVAGYAAGHFFALYGAAYVATLKNVPIDDPRWRQ